MTLLGIDVGTSYCKAGLFDSGGRTLRTASRPMSAVTVGGDYQAYDPEAVWDAVASAVAEACAGHPSPRSIGVASMAESGLLLDRRTGALRSPLLPWFDMSAQPQADRIAVSEDPRDFYIATGLRVGHKLSLAKILWLRDRDPAIIDGAIWLSAADYIAYRLTGAFGTDYSLAGRTGGFDIARRQWNAELLARWDISPALFPDAYPGGTPFAVVRAGLESLGIVPGTPVAVSGHDHIVAAFTAGPDEVFDSMGTAEALIGGFPERPLTGQDHDSGLLAGCHVAPGALYWLGGLSSSGGAVEWLRGLLSDPPLSYDQLVALADRAPTEPTGLLFFPYLNGSGSPHTDAAARAGLLGLSSSHSRADVAKAVLEGTAFELEFIRRAGERFTGRPIACLTAAGGGTRNRLWLRIKSDVSGVSIRVPAEADMTLLGAALTAGVGAGIYASAGEARAVAGSLPHATIEPVPARHARYRELFDHYCELQAPLRRFSAAEGKVSV